jgi:hypothetical protein
MVIVGDRGTKDRCQSVSQLLADDAAKLTYGGPHGRQRRLEARDSLLWLQIGNKTRGVYDVSAKNRHKPTFAVGVDPLTHCGSAFGAPAIVRIDRRLTREAMHSSAPKVAAILSTRIREQTLDKNTYREPLSNRTQPSQCAGHCAVGDLDETQS